MEPLHDLYDSFALCRGLAQALIISQGRLKNVLFLVTWLLVLGLLVLFDGVVEICAQHLIVDLVIHAFRRDSRI